MRLRDPGPPLDPVAADELAALEAILLGEPVGVEHESLRELTLLVKESAPRMPAAFRLELDERVDAGFPASSGRSGNGHRSRRHRGGRVRARLGRWSERWPGRWVTRWPLAASATFVVVAAVVAAAGVLGTGSGGPAQTPAVLQNPAPTATTQSLPYTAKPAVAPSTAPPIATARRQPLEAPAGASRAGAPTRATPAASPGSTATTPAPPSAASSPSAPSSPTARRVQRAASLTLATPTDSVANVADQVIGVTDRSGGIVRSSQVSSGDSSPAQATFDLSIPTSRLDTALAELSHLAHVRSRQQTSLDITDPYDAARASLNQALAQRQFLLRQLGRANNPRQAQSIRIRLRLLAHTIQDDQRGLARLGRASSYADVGVLVQGSGASTGGSIGGWSPDDGLRTALAVLSATLVVILVALAALVPSALVAAGVATTVRALRRRRREQALEGI